VAKVVRSQKKAGNLPKTDARHWLSRLFHNTYRNGDAITETKDLCARIARAGKRETFNLGTPNREAASRRAQEIYLSLLSKGWEETLAIYKPKAVKSANIATIGDYLAELQATVQFRQSTSRAYTQALRAIAAGVAGIGDQPAMDASGQPKKDRRKRIVYQSRRDHQGGGRDAWAAKVDALPLSILTGEAVQKWKLAYLAEHGSNPVKLQRAKHTVNSMIRSARSLFSERKDRLKHLRSNLMLPDPLPFQGVSLEEESSQKYVSKVDVRQLVAAAKRDLASDPAHREQFKVFCLGLLAGLRKREIDTLLWDQVKFDLGQIHIERTEFFEAKSKDSEAAVDCDEELLALLRGWAAQARGRFVIETKRKPRYHNAPASYYRADEHFKPLYVWLEAQGITDNKKLHTLRKELGSVLANEQGIFAAQQVLRHAHIQTTAKHYVDKRRAIRGGLGALLGDASPQMAAMAFPAPSRAKRPRRTATA